MLSGIKVLDLSRVFPGHYASLLLADLGAEVIKIEDTEHQDFLRKMPAFFNSANRNKKSLCLNLKTAEGKKIFLSLASKCQVVIENFRPGTADSLGIGYENLKEINPKIIYCAISGFGKDSVLKERGGHDLNFISMSGVLHATTDGEKPVLPGLSLGGFSGGMFASLSVLAALVQLLQTGEGCFIDSSILDGTTAMMDITSQKYSGGKPFQPVCNYIYKTKDSRWVALAAMEKKFWENFCRIVKRKDLLPYHRSPAIPENEGYKKMSALFGKRTLEEWSLLLENADCCFSPVLSTEEALESSHTKSRGLMMKIGDGCLQAGFPVKFSNFRQPAVPPPNWGEHSKEVLIQMGFSPEAIERLFQEGIVK